MHSPAYNIPFLIFVALLVGLSAVSRAEPTNLAVWEDDGDVNHSKSLPQLLELERRHTPAYKIRDLIVKKKAQSFCYDFLHRPKTVTKTSTKRATKTVKSTNTASETATLTEPGPLHTTTVLEVITDRTTMTETETTSVTERTDITETSTSFFVSTTSVRAPVYSQASAVEDRRRHVGIPSFLRRYSYKDIAAGCALIVRTKTLTKYVSKTTTKTVNGGTLTLSSATTTTLPGSTETTSTTSTVVSVIPLTDTTTATTTSTSVVSTTIIPSATSTALAISPPHCAPENMRANMYGIAFGAGGGQSFEVTGLGDATACCMRCYSAQGCGIWNWWPSPYSKCTIGYSPSTYNPPTSEQCPHGVRPTGFKVVHHPEQQYAAYFAGRGPCADSLTIIESPSEAETVDYT